MEGIVEEVAKLLKERKMWIATAESCTGGLIGHTLTNVPGSSEYFKGGVIAYSNEVKMKLLGVKRETLMKYGAVSSYTAEEMAKGVKELMEVDIGIATTGIAGPTGGSEEKPVGLVYIGLATDGGIEARRFVFDGDRLQNKESFCEAALNMVLEYLKR